MSMMTDFSISANQLFNAFRTMMKAAMADEAVTASFEAFSDFMQKGNTLKAALQLLKEAKDESILEKPSPRTLLAAFMVVMFPADIIEISEEELLATADDESRALDRSCFAIAKELVAAVTADDAEISDVLRKLASFQTVFVEWKEYDRQRILRSLANAHHQWVASLEHLEASRADTRDPESLEIMVESVKRQMAANKRRILQMGGPEAFEQVLATPPMQINLEQIMLELGSKKYWEEFAEELRQSPPKYDRIAVLLTEIRDRLKQLIPNRSDMQAQLERSLDVDFIRQMIHFNSFDTESFFRVFEVIWTHIKNFGAASAEAEWEEWRQQIMTKAQSGSVTYDVLLPEIFNKFLRQLDLIEDATARYREMMAQQNRAEIPAGASA